MLTAISLIIVSMVIILLSGFLVFIALQDRRDNSVGAFAGGIFMAALSVMSIVDATHFLITGSSLGAVPY